MMFSLFLNTPWIDGMFIEQKKTKSDPNHVNFHRPHSTRNVPLKNRQGNWIFRRDYRTMNKRILKDWNIISKIHEQFHLKILKSQYRREYFNRISSRDFTNWSDFHIRWKWNRHCRIVKYCEWRNFRRLMQPRYQRSHFSLFDSSKKIHRNIFKHH